jgi:hypothetical protein
MFLLTKGLNAKGIHKEICPVYCGKGFSRKAVYNWVDKFSQGSSKVENYEMEIRKWMRQQSKDF